LTDVWTRNKHITIIVSAGP